MQKDETAISVERVSFAYRERPVLHDVSFEARRGRLTVLLGRNGCGKSTLLRLIAGLLKKKHGRIEILGRDLEAIPRAERAKVIGFLPQFHAPVFPFTVEDVVLTGRASYVTLLPGSEDREKARAALQTVGIQGIKDRPYSDLSGGERQLVMMARVLAQEPRIILLDEPVSHLDLSNQTRLLHLIKNLTIAGTTALVVLHDPNAAFQCGDHFVFLKDGRVQAPGENSNPWDADQLSRIYDIPLAGIPFRGRNLVYPESPWESAIQTPGKQAVNGA